MTPKINDEQRQAIAAHHGEPVPVQDEQTDRLYFIVDSETHERAMQALHEQEDHAAIREGIQQMEAGQGRPIADVDANIRKEFGFPPRG